MATKKKLLQAAAGSAGGGAGLDVEEVFSTYLYTGTEASTQTITNNIDLSGEGGLVWVKARDGAINHVLMDTEQGIGKFLNSNQTYAQQTNSDGMKSFNSNGFTFGNQTGVGWSNDHVYWTFRKAPKFFDVQTWSGNSTSGRAIPHNLGTTPGMIIVKWYDGTQNWAVWHKDLTAGQFLLLNDTNAAVSNAAVFTTTSPTDSVFYVGNDYATNGTNANYVAYLFAHNDGDGEFGPDGDLDIIKCGSYTEAASGAQEINLGFEPQWLMVKPSSGAGDWWMYDTMRGQSYGGSNRLKANLSDAEAAQAGYFAPTPNGFIARLSASGFFGSGVEVIYMAIRRGTKVPESATEVFEVFETTNTGTASTIGSMGPSDFILNKRTDAAATWRAIDRLRGGSMLRTDSTDTETSASNFLEWDKMGGVFVTTQGAPYITNDSQAHWMWKRAPGYFDVVAYSGDGTLNQTFNHNLTVKPDMVWIKNRGRTQDWWVALDDSIVNLDGRLNSSGDFGYSVIGTFTDTTVQTLNQNQFATNYSGDTYIAYLFASLDGISKVGSYTGTGATLNIDCGFTSGARFVFLKRTDAAGQWLTFDSERGITLANSPVLFLNSDSAEDSGYDIIDPYSSGFTVTADATYEQNISGGSYIFYAIA